MKAILFLNILLIFTSAYSQEFLFDIHNTSLDSYIQNEEKLGSERISSKVNYVLLSGDAQPIIYKRKEEFLISYYFFKESDSTMSYILHEWDVHNSKNKVKSYDKQPISIQKAFINKYHEVEKNITQLYGSPISEGDLSDLNNANSKVGLRKQDTWNLNDSIKIELQGRIRNYYENKGNRTTVPIHRIKLYIRNLTKVKNIEQELNEIKIMSLDIVSKDFFNALKNKDFSKSKDYLSDLIKNQISEQQLFMLTENFNFNKELELIYTGVQTVFNGSNLIVLDYKYVDDNSTPPEDMLKLIFDDKDKIVGIQPQKLQSK